MKIEVPELSLILLVGVSASGKSTFARKHFSPYEIVSSDECRGIVSNNANDQAASADAFELLNYIIGKRLKNGLLTVVDATNIQTNDRKKLISLAKSYHALPVAFVFDLPERVCLDRNEIRSDRNMGAYVIRRQRSILKRGLRGLKKEGFTKQYFFKSQEETDAIKEIVREKLYSNKKEKRGPFDIIGDIHGCYDETLELLAKLEYQITDVDDDGQNFGLSVSHPENRQVIFLGDLVDRGPNSPGVLKLAMSMVNQGIALCVPGNHDVKLQKKLKGKNVQVKHGMAETLAQLEGESPEFMETVREFLYRLTSHFVLDDGKLVVAHAGLKDEMQGRGSAAVRSFCLYGETTGEIDEFGLPVRYNWATEYRGKARVVYGHTPVPYSEWLNRTINIDTGCVFGGKLTALRYPEEELISVEAKKKYCEPARPIAAQSESMLSQQHVVDDLLDIEDVSGLRIVQTRLKNNITIKEENSIAALEVVSRFAVNPKWLIYLPPTMSPCGTSELEGMLEHPIQAINYYKKRNIKQVICEEKHMGSRAIVVLCKDEKAARERFGITNEGIGICYTRTGRNFFNNPDIEEAFLTRLAEALTKSKFWEKFETTWVCLDCELMPWSAKAQSLIRSQYAAVGAAANSGMSEVNQALQAAMQRGVEGMDVISSKFDFKQKAVDKYINAYQQYCWEVESLEDYKLAPFHIMATEGQVHIDKNHEWHMKNIHDICRVDEAILRATSYISIDTYNPESVLQAVNWWTELTSRGGEGMVLKPLDFIVTGEKGLLQPAIKCRGKEYLRIIYGPEYDLPEHLERLRIRGLSRKRSLALREFALGIEALERFVRKEPLRRVHESVFGVLSLESEEVDPRL